MSIFYLSQFSVRLRSTCSSWLVGRDAGLSCCCRFVYLSVFFFIWTIISICHWWCFMCEYLSAVSVCLFFYVVFFSIFSCCLLVPFAIFYNHFPMPSQAILTSRMCFAKYEYSFESTLRHFPKCKMRKRGSERVKWLRDHKLNFSISHIPKRKVYINFKWDKRTFEHSSISSAIKYK